MKQFYSLKDYLNRHFLFSIIRATNNLIVPMILPLLYDAATQPSHRLKVCAPFEPSADQQNAIQHLSQGILEEKRDQVLLGVTGSGKTFTMAKVIERLQKPALILAPNKTLAAQLYAEMQSFFPHNAVEYFVSYYDYYQPEAYVPRTDTYIEKESSINEQIDRMRHSATRALLERKDVVIVASVSCIYGIGGVNTYSQMILSLKMGDHLEPQEICRKLVELHYKRNDISFTRGTFRLRGDLLEIFPSHYEDRAWRLSFFGDEIESITEIDALTGNKILPLEKIRVFANSHYVTPGPTLFQAIKSIQRDAKVRVKEFEEAHKLIEAQRLGQRTKFDVEMMSALGTCPGIENYSRYLTGRAPGEPPPTLFEYLPPNALLFVDESHVTVPQLNGMYKGDRARKQNLSDFGFRLPACLDNRPLKFEEWESLRPQTIFVSATPSPWELTQTQGEIVEQVTRPTGLVDPPCLIRPCAHQVDDLIAECKFVVTQGWRILVTTLTKKMAEALAEYLNEAGLHAKYMHSDIETLERIELIRSLRLGEYDVLIGINLLREGLDIPECGLVAILDADKEGFLRSKSSLIQTIGRAARNLEGRVILYADKITGALEAALAETDRRRHKQKEYNEKYGITPQSIQKSIEVRSEEELKEGKNWASQIDGKSKGNKKALREEGTPFLYEEFTQKSGKVAQGSKRWKTLSPKKLKAYKAELEKKMLEAAQNLDFEKAVPFRDELKALEKWELNVL